MFQRQAFYLQYALRNLWRSRRWSAFAVLSVAAGVATMVALRSLGLAIGDSLTDSVRASNHGDITLSMGANAGGFGAIFSGRGDDDANFSDNQVRVIEDWVSRRGGTMASYISTTVQVSALDFNTAGRLQFTASYFIDPQTYPPTQDIRAINPRGVPLGELFEGGNEVVISDNLADQQNIDVGDFVRVSGTDEPYIVRGIVPTDAESGLRDLLAAFFGFAYFDISQTETLAITPNPNRISLTLPEGTTNEEIRQAGDEVFGLLQRNGRSASVTTVPSLLELNEAIADVVSRFVVVMGLGAMLLGGVGIINTMLVIVRRRTGEIAALKTFGLKGRQIGLLFMTEAVLLGFIGSVVGSIIGVILSYFTNAFGETVIQRSLTFRIYPEAILFGTILGVVVTGIFGLLPVLTALRVRPNIILRPNETVIPRASILQTIFALIFVVISLGLIAGQIIGPIPEEVPGPNNVEIGLIGVAVTLTILAVLVGLLWILVWIVSKFPSFGVVDLRLALRNMTTQRIRTATTLLALSAGMFALSSITFWGAGVREVISVTLTDTLGGNVIIIPLIPSELAQPIIDGRLDQMEGVDFRTTIIRSDVQIVSIDGQSMGQIRAQSPDNFIRGWLDTSVYNTTNPNLSSGTLQSGRSLQLADHGQSVAVIKMNSTMLAAGAGVGSTLVVEYRGRNYTLEVVGTIAEDQTLESGLRGDIQLPPETIPDIASDNFQLNVVQVSPENLNDVLVSISSIPLVFALDITFIDGFFSRLIEQFSALPFLVGLLSTGAAAVIMANTVALSTLERRRQIGILKAVGLKGKRVLRIMLLENLIVSLLGGIIGIGLSAIGVAVMTTFGLADVVFIPKQATPIAIALVVAAVMIALTATFLSANVAVRERVLNVLRYE
ncbi:MAG: FtsX-like permease family protein [Aggregatilineales bacterium]